MIEKKISTLRKLSTLLFILPFLALIGSLLTSNFLVTIDKFGTYPYFEVINNKQTITETICNKKNNFCFDYKKEYQELYYCDEYVVNSKYIDIKNLNKLTLEEAEDLIAKNTNFKIRFEKTSIKNPSCISNSKLRTLYKIFPFFIDSLKKFLVNNEINLGSSEAINPIFYGEASISNIVKRYPINFIFKPMMYLSVITMILYWSYYQKIFQSILKKKINSNFLIFGMLSAVFLLLHSYFLGKVFDNEFLTKLRRTFIIFFIIFEVLAQFYLMKFLVNNKEKLLGFVNPKIIILKKFFVYFILLCTSLVLFIFIFYDLTSQFDYFLEWNYFLILLIFYILSFLLWKRSILNPATT